MQLSFLNFFSPPDEVVRLAKIADELESVHRFWIGEHHSRRQVPVPLTLATLIAGVTERIRVGTGGVALVLQNPYLVAEAALLAELFFPGRLDLGVTKGGAAPPDVLSRLLDGQASDAVMATYDRKLELVRDLLARNTDMEELFLADRLAVGPAMFSMGMTAHRARRAGELGLGFVSSFHHGGDADGIRQMLRVYRESFRPSPMHDRPRSIVLLSGMVSDDPARVAEARLDEERLKQMPGFSRTVTLFDRSEAAALELRRLGALVEADEVMFLPMEPDAEDCYLSLARGWEATEPRRAAG